jgi:hypothetical protein
MRLLLAMILFNLSLGELLAYQSKIDFSGIARQKKYLEKNLTLDESVDNELLVLEERITLATLKMYELCFEESQDIEQAKIEVKSQMENDLKLISPEFHSYIRSKVEQILSEKNSPQDFSVIDLKRTLKHQVLSRLEILKSNNDLLLTEIYKGDPPTGSPQGEANASFNDETDPILPISPKSYKTNQELVQHLISNAKNERWVSSASITVESVAETTAKENFSAQLKAEFLGVEASIGPTINFWKKYTTHVTFMAEGLNPIHDQQGNFDYFMRDKKGKIIQKDGENIHRYLVFYCNASEQFGNEAMASGGIKAFGIGAESEIVTTYIDKVDINSRRILVPETIAGKMVNLSMLRKICHNDFLNGKTDQNITVKKSIDNQVKALVSSLRYVNPQTSCATDKQCVSWFISKVNRGQQKITIPRCVERKKGEGILICASRGSKGSPCPVYQQGELVSSGVMESVCDKGLKCLVNHTGGWLQNWSLYDPYIAKCQ